MVVARLGQGSPFRSISTDEIRGLLRDAGVNVAPLNFVGAAACTVNRSDVEYDEGTALEQWIRARQQTSTVADPTTQPVTQPSVASGQPVEDTPVRSLGKLLVDDLAQRVNLPPESLQVTFRPQDEKVLALAEPLFKFEIEHSSGRLLGSVTWRVTVVSDGATHATTIRADARVWQTQVVLAKPLAFKQVIREEDLIERRALIDRLDDSPNVARADVIGQQAARELPVGTVLNARMIDPVQLVRPGQYVTISLSQGNVQIKTVAKAMEGGSYGQTIRVKNETTRDVFQVVLTGPQTATMNLAAAAPPTPSQNVANAKE